MNADVLSTKVTEGIAVITLGSAKRMYFDAEMGDALTENLQEFAGDPNIRVVIVTGGTPGYFNRHFSIPALIEFAEAVRASGRQWPDNAAYHGGFFDKAMALCETMPKPVIAAISGTALAGAFEFTLACDIRIAEDGDYLIGLPETELGPCREPVEHRGCPARSDRRRPSCTSLWGGRSIRVTPKRRVLFTKPSVARPSIVRWRSQNGSARIHRNRSAISSVSSAVRSTRLSLKDWLLSEISS